jgi:hypothetical protein
MISGPVLHKTVPGRVVPWILRSMAERSASWSSAEVSEWSGGGLDRPFIASVRVWGWDKRTPSEEARGADVEFCKHMRPQQHSSSGGLIP